MKVSLVDCSHDALGNIVLAARGCFGNKKKNPTYEDNINLVKALIAKEHSPIEFGWAMFKISGISRACADQLTRHRLASFAVQSQRYVDIQNNGFVHPFKALEIAGESVEAYVDMQKAFYKKLVDNGVPKEDARNYMGMGMETELCMACNFRELRHILKMRLDRAAQSEVRHVAKEIYDICVERWPWLLIDIEP